MDFADDFEEIIKVFVLSLRNQKLKKEAAAVKLIAF